MYIFTPLDYVYQQVEYKMLMSSFLQDCKSQEEKDKANREYQGIGLFSTIVGFVAGLIVCGIITLLC